MKGMKDGIGKKIRKLGKPVELRGDSGVLETRAIIDPVHSVSKAARTVETLPDGYFPPGSYQYFGLPEGDLTEVREVVAGDTVYLIRRKELYEMSGVGLYWWALMIQGGGANAGA